MVRKYPNTANDTKYTDILMHVTIFSNGDFQLNKIDLQGDTTIIAADGGAHHCLSLGITPDIIIGDFDSLSEEELLIFEKKGSRFHRYPSSKNETDLELALIYAVGIGATEVTLYGLLGGRSDMSFSNLTLLSSPRFDNVNFFIETINCTIRLLRSGMRVIIKASKGALVSLIPLCPGAYGITTYDLEWKLRNESLEFGSQRGLSNRMKNSRAQISMMLGKLLIIIDKENNIQSGEFSAEYSSLE